MWYHAPDIHAVDIPYHFHSTACSLVQERQQGIPSACQSRGIPDEDPRHPDEGVRRIPRRERRDNLSTDRHVQKVSLFTIFDIILPRYGRLGIIQLIRVRIDWGQWGLKLPTPTFQPHCLS